MSYGDGSITEVKRPDGRSYSSKRWRVCVSYTVGEPQPDGTVKSRRKKVQRNVTGTKAQAKEERDRIVAERDAEGRVLSTVERQKAEAEQAKAMTLTRMIDLWDAARRTAAKASEKTMRDDRNRLRLVEAQLGEMPLASIKPQDVEAAYAAIREGRELCGTTLRHIHTLLKNDAAAAQMLGELFAGKGGDDAAQKTKPTGNDLAKAAKPESARISPECPLPPRRRRKKQAGQPAELAC